METDRSETHLKGPGDVDNVVPFPRDWIGPTEDLVPIGSPAAGTVSDDLELGRALGADAFWGESSASLHEAIEAPPDPDGDVAVVPAVACLAKEVADAPARAGRQSRRTFGPGLRRGGSVIAAVGVLVACCVAVGVAVAAHVGAHRTSSNLAVTLKPPDASAGHSRSVSTESASLSQLMVGRAIERASREANGQRQRSAHHRASAAPGPRVRDKDRPSTFATIRYTASDSESASAADDSSSAIADQPSAGGSSGSSSSSGGAGPTGAGAPFGPGQMTSASG